MRNRDKIIIRFVGIDEWCRAVFREAEGNRWFKSVELVPDQFPGMTDNAWEFLLHSLHTTDEFEGEPGFPVPREQFTLMRENGEMNTKGNA